VTAARPLKIGITCFATFGGSGIVATEVGLAMAARGHEVHFIARALPVRLHPTTPGVFFHEVVEPDHAVLLPDGAYPIALASKIIEVTQQFHLDLLHVHYAVPHATAAWMARAVLGPDAPKLVTTLHGTDITLVGSDASYLPITRFSVLQSDAVTTPSAFLREATWTELDLPRSMPITVVQNFVDTRVWHASPERDVAPLQELFTDWRDGEAVLVHVSNFRPVKRIADVVAIFQAVHAERPARLLLIGDGPDCEQAEAQLESAGLADRVAFLGRQEHFAKWLAAADVFLLPSATESFGLAALEAMACGVPVVASDVGGLPEVVAHGETGFLAPLGDVAAMAGHVLWILADRARWQRLSMAGLKRVNRLFQTQAALDAYESVYRQVLKK
jgi:N-acetyl-alpha-D-glucosaminyl L-malate synthase BshA